MQIVGIHCTDFEMCVNKSKIERKSKIENFLFDFLDCEKDQWNSGSIFYIRTTKVFCL